MSNTSALKVSSQIRKTKISAILNMPNPNIIRNLIQLTHSVDHFSDELDESAVVTKYKYLF